jgi:uncharacterized tellurite resistance protein B-like protein
MILRIKQFFESHLIITSTSTVEDVEHKLKLTCAILMLEMMHVDEHIDKTEEEIIKNNLQQQFSLTESETDELLTLAHEEKMDATDYYKFTSLINEHYSQEQKVKLVEQLWQVAYADNVIDRFEEHLVRKLAELLHVPHKHFIQAKHRASEN